MVYESDFYTTRRPYRASPSLSTYTITSEPSRQIRILPGLGKVHVVHSYDRIVPYVGNKRLTVVTAPPVVVRVRPSVLYREFDRIENKYRPMTYNSYTNDYLNSESSVRIVYTRNPISDSYYYTDYYRPKGSTTTTSTYTYHWPPVPRTYPRLYSYLSYPYYYPYTYSYTPFWPTTRLYSYYSDYRPSHNYSNYYDYLADSLLYPCKNYRFSRMFDDETRLIRAQSAALLKRVSYPVPRAYRAMPLPYISSRYEDYPVRWTNDNYINKMLIASPTSNYKSDYTTYSTEPVRKYFGQGHLAAVTLVGDRAHPRRRNVYVYVEPENRHHPVMKDIELMSYYINRMKQDRAIKQKTMPSIAVLDPARRSRIFSVPKSLEDPAMSGEIAELREQRAARLARIMDVNEEPAPARPKPAAATAAPSDAKAKTSAAAAAKKREQEEGDRRKAEEKRAKAEEAARKERDAQAKKEEAARKAELARQEELAAQAAAEKAAEAERLAELARQEESAKQAEIAKARAAEAERVRLDEAKRLADEAKAEEERQQLLRLEEIARQAEEEKEGELARQADELAELARQEAELAEQAKRDEEVAEEARKAAEAEDLAKKQAELEELERKEKELEEQAKAEAELAEQARLDAEAALVEAQAAQEDAVAAEEADAEPVVEEAPEESVADAVAEADNNAEASDDQMEIPADVESPAEEE